MIVVDMISKFIEETRGHPLEITIPEAELLQEFAIWIDNKSAQQGVQAELLTPQETEEIRKRDLLFHSHENH
jgi:hypothetical protein